MWSRTFRPLIKTDDDDDDDKNYEDGGDYDDGDVDDDDNDDDDHDDDEKCQIWQWWWQIKQLWWFVWLCWWLEPPALGVCPQGLEMAALDLTDGQEYVDQQEDDHDEKK